MTKEQVIALIKKDLQISVSNYDDDIAFRLELALGDLERRGISIDMGEASDCALAATYAAWLIRDRKKQTKPVNLERLINNRLLSEKMGGE